MCRLLWDITYECEAKDELQLATEAYRKCMFPPHKGKKSGSPLEQWSTSIQSLQRNMIEAWTAYRRCALTAEGKLSTERITDIVSRFSDFFHLLSEQSILTRRTPVSNIVTERQGMQQIMPGLWCGSYHPAANHSLLTECGITHICVCIGTAPRFPSDFEYLVLDAEDTITFSIRPLFDASFDFIDEALLQHSKALTHAITEDSAPPSEWQHTVKGGVLIHCGAGISRAPTMTAAYLMRKHRISATSAVSLITAARPFAHPNCNFMKQLREYGEELRLRHQ